MTGDFIRIFELAWQPVLSLIAIIVWLVRLEGKVSHNKDRIGDLRNWSTVMDEKHANLDSKIVDQLGQIRESLARLEGKLGVDNK